MFKHILLPTDGSDLSTRAVRAGINLAKSVAARVTVVHATTPFDASQMLTQQMKELARELEERAKSDAARALEPAKDAAREAGVACDVLHQVSDSPSEEIIKVATEQGCDLILMASHGRRGISALLLGSETAKVLTHSKVPVLVWR